LHKSNRMKWDWLRRCSGSHWSCSCRGFPLLFQDISYITSKGWNGICNFIKSNRGSIINWYIKNNLSISWRNCWR
jgi:hypothetical protein